MKSVNLDKIIPKGQIRVLTYKSAENKYYIVTRDRLDKYTLYSWNDSKLTKLKTANEPTKFKEVYPKGE